MKRINTPRLILKAMRSSDCAGLCEVLGDPQTADDLKSFVVDSIERAQLYIQRGNCPGDCRYGIFERDSASFIGIIEIHVKEKKGERELAYALSRSFRGKGYMTEAVRAVCDHIFYNPAVDVVSLRVLPANLPSQAVARRAGFVLEPQTDSEKDYLLVVSRFDYRDGCLCLEPTPFDRLVLTRERHATGMTA